MTKIVIDNNKPNCSICVNYCTLKPEGVNVVQKSKNFNVLLKISFFKNELYRIFCDGQKMFFKCLEGSDRNFTLSLSEINGIYIYGDPAREIEIRTKNRVIIGIFRSTKTSNRAVNILREALGEKLVRVHQ